MSIGIFLPAALLCATVLVAACGTGEDRKMPEVEASVNGSEAPLHESTRSIARMERLELHDIPWAHVAGRHKDQELLVQKAVEARLDRDPEVMRSVERAKRQILAQAYLEKAAGQGLQSSAEEIRDFYRSNPALFGERRIYRVQELSVVMSPERTGDLEAKVAKAGNLLDVVRWLEAQQLPFHIVSATRAAEHVPLDLLPRLAKMKDGQVTVFPASQGASVVQRMQSRAAPLTEHQARPLIEQFLSNRKRLALAESEVKRLRAGARMRYAGARYGAATPAVAAPGAGGGVVAGESITRSLSGMN